MDEQHDLPRSPGIGAHLLVPACLSGLLLVVFFPLILRLSAADYQPATDHSAPPYLIRWLLLTAALFLASGLVYAVRKIRRRAPQQDEDRPSRRV